MKLRTENFDLTLDNRVINVKATAFQTPASETRFRVSVNDSPVHIFALNESLNRYTDVERSTASNSIPVNIEEAIGRKLYNALAA